MYLSQDAEDAALVSRCQAGDHAGFELLVRRYERVLFNVALRMVGDRETAADATQNTFVRVYEHLGEFDFNHRFFSWAYRILVNECLNILRSRRPGTEGTGSLAATDAGPFEKLARSERHHRIQAALMSLPPDYREVVVLRHFAGLSYKNIATTIGLPVKTVRSRLYTARQRLGELLLGWEPD